MRRRRFVSLLPGAVLPPLLARPAFADPADACAGIDNGVDSGIDVGALCRMADRLAATSNIHAVLVARGGRLVFERYFRGPDEIQSRRVGPVAFDAGTLHDMKSVSKAIASLAVGIAIDRGLIRSVEEPLFSFFPELADLRTPDKDRLRLVHALTMTMGLRWIEATPETGDEDNDEARMHRSADPCRYVLGLPITQPPGQSFFYDTGALALVAAIVRKATGQPLDDFARTALLEPLGITDAPWIRVKGETDAGGGLRLRPRDMVKLGQLVLAGGQWNGRQVVSKAWIEESTAAKTVASSTYSYGYLWWLGRSSLQDRVGGHEGDRVVPWAAALGRGGQSIRIVPALDLVVAVTAGYYQDYSKRAFALQAGVFHDILQAVEG
jgi:CubicO group peptidase (beta-lactamase class C family)